MANEKGKNNHSSGLRWWIAGGAALALAFLAMKNFAAARRYLKMEMM